MRSLLARLAVLGAFALSACGGGTGTTLPFAGPPNAAGGTGGTFQSGGNGTALLRFVQGSPDKFVNDPVSGGTTTTVDVCVDNLPFNLLNPAVTYGSASPSGLYSIPAIPHTIAVYPGLTNGQAGAECPTAPGPYLLFAPIQVTTFTPGANSRITVVLGGTAASKTLGFYLFSEPVYGSPPAGMSVISHNAAPVFTATTATKSVGFGICTTTVTPCAAAVALTGAQSVTLPAKALPNASTLKTPVTSGINSIPAGFYDGMGVPAGAPVPITSIAAPNAIANQPYVIELYAIDGPAGGLNLVPVVEQTLGFGF